MRTISFFFGQIYESFKLHIQINDGFRKSFFLLNMKGK